jgi:hypothetical protein
VLRVIATLQHYIPRLTRHHTLNMCKQLSSTSLELDRQSQSLHGGWPFFYPERYAACKQPEALADTVNTASRMESTGLPGHIHISSATYRLLPPHEAKRWECRGELEVKVSGLQVAVPFLYSCAPCLEPVTVRSGAQKSYACTIERCKGTRLPTAVHIKQLLSLVHSLSCNCFRCAAL